MRAPVNSSIPSNIWEASGVTEHMGGVYATRRMIQACQLVAGQRVLDIGCGTAYTACLIAKESGVHVTAIDINPRSVAEARHRVQKQGLEKRVEILQADAHHLSFNSGCFDAAVVESVLVFCSAGEAACEIARVLKPGGTFADNEITLRRIPPTDLAGWLKSGLGIQICLQEEWHSVFAEAGFTDLHSSLYPINLWEQLVSHIQVDGFSGYLRALVGGLGNRPIRKAFFTREMLSAARHFMPYVGYGIYTGKKLDLLTKGKP